MSLAAKIHLIKTLDNITESIFFRSSSPAHKPAAICVNMSPTFLWAVYWRLQDKWGLKADCCSLFSLPVLNHVM